MTGEAPTSRTTRLPRRRFLLRTAAAAIALSELNRPAARDLVWAQASIERPRSVRVLLRGSDANIDAVTARVSSEGSFAVRDAATDVTLIDAAAGSVVSVGRDGDGVWYQVADGRRQGPVSGPIAIIPGDSTAYVLNRSAGREPAATAYHGRIEVFASSKDGRVVLINVVSLDEYLAGVLPREMPASFGTEALRVQAVAARGFVLSRINRGVHRSSGADVCDATDCQVYGGVGVEHPTHNAALQGTRGQVLLRDGVQIETLYSSACGGHTESPSRLFGSGLAPAYPEAVADGTVPPDLELGLDESATMFFKSSWESNCAASPRYRWSVAWDRRRLEEILDENLRKLGAMSAVTPSFGADSSIGTLSGLAVTRRGFSGRALGLRIEGTKGVWTVDRDWNVRNVLRAPTGELLNSSAIAIELERSYGGSIGRVTAFGAGWGHGAGLCQWGARGLANKGLGYDAILTHYFPGTDLGPAPTVVA